MADDYFDAKLALDASNNPVPSAIADVYAFTDTAFTTPLAITDFQDIPIAKLIASPTGIYPSFKVVGGVTQVLAKSGPMVTPLTSVQGMKGEPGEKGDPGSGVDTTTSEPGQVLTSVGAGLDPVWAPGGGTPSWDAITGKPNTYNPTTHSQPAATISDSSSVGRAVLTATDAQSARAAIGAGTGNGTSNLTLGTTSSQAMPGNRVFAASEVTFTPNPGGPLAGSSTVSAALELAAQSGSGGSGTATTYYIDFRNGQYQAFPANLPAGVKEFVARGPVQPTVSNVSGGIPSYVGLGANQVPLSYKYWPFS